MGDIAINSSFALESLDSLKASRPVQQQKTQDLGGDSLQSLDSLMANRNTSPKGRIPANEDILAPIDAISPEISTPQKEDTREKGVGGFALGVGKGFLKAGGDTVMGVVTLGKVVVTGELFKAAGNGIKYAVHNPGKAAKAVAFDLPMGIVKGIVNPYAEAIGSGKYGEATGRAVFDVGLILMTAGMTKDKPPSGVDVTPSPVTPAADAGKTVTEVVTDVGKKTSKGTKIVSGGGGAGKIVTNSITGGVKIGKGALKEIKEVVKVSGNGKINGPVIINIGGVVNTAETTVNATTAATRVAKTSKTAKVLQEVAQNGGAIESIAESAETVTQATKGAGIIAIGFGEIKGAIGRGFSRISQALRPVGTGINNGLDTVIGVNGANAVRTVVGTVGKGISISINAGKNTVAFVKANPVTSTILAGKTTDIITKGLQASDYYDPVNDPIPNDPIPGN